MYVSVGKQVFDFIDNTKLFFNSLWLDIVDLGFFLITLKGILILIVIFSPLILYWNYKINKKIYKSLLHRRQRINKIFETEEEIEQLLKTDTKDFDKDNLEKIFSKLRDKLELAKESREFRKFVRSLSKKKNIVKFKLLKAKKKEVLNNLESEKNSLEYQIGKLKKEEERRRFELENKNFSIRLRLGADREDAFLRNELSDEEIEALQEDGWESANEYDVMEKRTIPVLVKKILNHSKTHTFLVWSVKRLLEEQYGIIADKHDTRYPDITFFHNNEWWAIEIEKGSLLKKRNQMRAKVSFLNRKFPGRWMFVVTNKNYLP